MALKNALTPIKSTDRENIQVDLTNVKETDKNAQSSLESIKVQSYRDYAGSRKVSADSQSQSSSIKRANNLTLVDKNILSQVMKQSCEKQ